MSLILLLILAAIGGAAYYFLVFAKSSDAPKEEETKSEDKPEEKDPAKAKALKEPNTVALTDIRYMTAQLGPKSNHMDVLFAVASSPENVQYGWESYQAKEKVRRERIEADLEEAKEASKKPATDETKELFQLDDDGWADDDADDEKAKLAAKEQEEKEKEREQLNKAVGKTKPKLEGIDKGVLGQKWVEKILSSKGVWPPKNLGILEGKEFDLEGKMVSAMDHPGLRRNICMIVGRLFSLMLNSHAELLEAGSKQMVDQTYFKASVDFRSRCALLLEGALRTSIACRNYPLAKTIVETVCMFKIGTPSPNMTEWFNGLMQKQYGALPRLKVDKLNVGSPNATNKKELATGDVLVVELELNRLHAEAFTRQKIAMFQKQGIPPQVALQSYREGWWFLVRAQRMDGEAPASALEIKTSGILKEVDEKDVDKFRNAKFEERLLTAWPMVLQNVAQKLCKVRVQFLAPPIPGKYRFFITIKSQDFLGADQEFAIEAPILDVNTLDRPPKTEEPKEDEKETDTDPQAKKEN